MARKGREFEQLVHQLENDLAGSGAQVISPGFLKDRITQQSREFDIVVMLNTAHHSHVIALECRDRKTPIGVPDVEAFYSKSKGCKVTKLVMASSSGFRSSAIEKANFYNIDCISLLGSSDHSWLGINHLNYHELKLLYVYFKIVPEGLPKQTHKDLLIMHNSGVVLTNEILCSDVNEFLSENILDRTEYDTEYENEISVDEKDIYLENRLTGEVLLPNTDSKFIVVFKKEVSQVAFAISDYTRVVETGETGESGSRKVAASKRPY